MRFVLDCSVALKCFLPEESSGAALEALRRVRTGELLAAAPSIFWVEFAHALRKHVVGRRITRDDAMAIWRDARRLPVALVADQELIEPALGLALDCMGTVYDALYVALADREGLQVLTADEGMVRAFASVGCVRRFVE